MYSSSNPIIYHSSHTLDNGAVISPLLRPLSTKGYCLIQNTGWMPLPGPLLSVPSTFFPARFVALLLKLPCSTLLRFRQNLL